MLIRFDMCFCPCHNDATTTKDSVVSANTRPDRSNRWAANSTMESRKLSHKESDWNTSGTALRNTQTGHSCPALNGKGSVEESSSDDEEDAALDGSDDEEECAPNSSDTDDSNLEAK